jgi:hypothetical protein
VIHLVVLRLLPLLRQPQRKTPKEPKQTLQVCTGTLHLHSTKKISSSRYITIEGILLLVDTRTTNYIYNSVPNFTFQVSLVWMRAPYHLLHHGRSFCAEPSSTNHCLPALCLCVIRPFVDSYILYDYSVQFSKILNYYM